MNDFIRKLVWDPSFDWSFPYKCQPSQLGI